MSALVTHKYIYPGDAEPRAGWTNKIFFRDMDDYLIFFYFILAFFIHDSPSVIQKEKIYKITTRYLSKKEYRMSKTNWLKMLLFSLEVMRSVFNFWFFIGLKDFLDIKEIQAKKKRKRGLNLSLRNLFRLKFWINARFLSWRPWALIWRWVLFEGTLI